MIYYLSKENTFWNVSDDLILKIHLGFSKAKCVHFLRTRFIKDLSSVVLPFLSLSQLLINSISNQIDVIIQSKTYFLRFPMCRVVAITLLILSSKNSDIAFCPSDNSDVKNSNSRTDLS